MQQVCSSYYAKSVLCVYTFLPLCVQTLIMEAQCGLENIRTSSLF